MEWKETKEAIKNGLVLGFLTIPEALKFVEDKYKHKK